MMWQQALACLCFVEESRDSWKLFRRLFLVDNISGRQEVSSTGKREYHSDSMYNCHTGVCLTMQFYHVIVCTNPVLPALGSELVRKVKVFID